jgi:hypothetical protein
VNSTRTFLIWTALVVAVGVPVFAAATSPLLAWRSPIYIAAGLAGVIAMALMLFQPLLVAGYVPGLPANRARHVHGWVGGTLVAAVVIHVVALWVTSPPDVIDALLFVSPTPFSVWGVVAMWAVFTSAGLAVMRRRLRLRVWRRAHTALAVTIVIGSVVHALRIDGTMEPVSKAVLCLLLLVVTLKAVVKLQVWTTRARQKP